MSGVHKTDDPSKALGDRRARAVASTDFEKGLLMPIRIAGRDNRLRQRHLIDRTGLIAPSKENPVVSCANRNVNSRTSRESIQ